MHEIREKPARVEHALLVAVQLPGKDTDDRAGLLDELEELVATLGIAVSGRRLLRARKPHARFLCGPGAAAGMIEEADARGCDVIVFDNELSPAQQRNWEAAADNRILVIDRQEVILDIFAERAHTREASLQVELARLEYNLPRLRRAWTHLNRQRGGGAVQRDAGETQLELDQRMVRARIARVKTELAAVVRHRAVQRKQRRSIPVPTAAIVGYTNAGKSSLLNALTGASALVEDKLFATLDPTSRRCALPGGRTLVVTDTVGFVRNLPHGLVEAFKATLEEAVVADFILHVVDAGDPDAEAHVRTTLEVLEELGATDKTIVTVFNKVDRVDRDSGVGIRSRTVDGCFVSALTGEGIAGLLQRLADTVERTETRLRLEIPHARYDLVARIHREGSVIRQSSDERGYQLTVSVPGRLLDGLGPYIVPGISVGGARDQGSASAG